jgi:hypothetical protein
MKNRLNTEDMPKMILSCNIMGGESYALVNDVDEYYKRLETLLDDISNGKGKACNYLYFAFVSLASATLEYSLNFMLSVHCFKKYNYPMYEKHLQSFIDIKYTTKIEITPEIVSEGKYTIKEGNSTLQCLKELVNMRNKLLHNSKAVKVTTFDFPNTGAKILDGEVFVPLDSLNDDGSIDFSVNSRDNEITTINARWCIRMGNAIRNYLDNIVTPYLIHNSLEVNDLFVPCK